MGAVYSKITAIRHNIIAYETQKINNQHNACSILQTIRPRINSNLDNLKNQHKELLSLLKVFTEVLYDRRTYIRFKDADKDMLEGAAYFIKTFIPILCETEDPITVAQHLIALCDNPDISIIRKHDIRINKCIWNLIDFLEDSTKTRIGLYDVKEHIDNVACDENLRILSYMYGIDKISLGSKVISDVDLSYIRIENRIIRNLKIINCKLNNAIIRNVKFINCTFDNVDANSLKIENVTFEKLKLKKLIFLKQKFLIMLLST